MKNLILTAAILVLATSAQAAGGKHKGKRDPAQNVTMNCDYRVGQVKSSKPLPFNGPGTQTLFETPDKSANIAVTLSRTRTDWAKITITATFGRNTIVSHGTYEASGLSYTDGVSAVTVNCGQR